MVDVLPFTPLWTYGMEHVNPITTSPVTWTRTQTHPPSDRVLRLWHSQKSVASLQLSEQAGTQALERTAEDEQSAGKRRVAIPFRSRQSRRVVCPAGQHHKVTVKRRRIALHYA